jgi:hypothetical protein
MTPEEAYDEALRRISEAKAYEEALAPYPGSGKGRSG